MLQKIQSDGYAVLIGVNDYTAYDRSTGGLGPNGEPGPSQLAGSLNDVRAWWRVSRQMGFDPSRIKILASPIIPYSNLEGATPEELQMAEATAENIKAAIEWIAQKLGSDKDAIGLVTYSGHGDWVEGQGLALCPSDVQGEDLKNAVPTNDLAEIVNRHDAGQNLTVVLDCCHAAGGTVGAGPSLRQKLALRGRPLPEAEIASTQRISERALSACQIGTVAYQAQFAAHWHGAFTWALTSVLGQWQYVQQGSVERLDVSYGTAMARSRALLASLSFDQTPTIHGEDVVKRLAFFQPGTEVQPGATTELPDGPRRGMEVHPDWVFTLNFSSSTRQATIYVLPLYPGESYTCSGTTYTGGTMGCYYWFYPAENSSLQKAIGSLSTLTVSGSDFGRGNKQSWINANNLSTLNYTTFQRQGTSSVPNSIYCAKMPDGNYVGVDFEQGYPTWYSSSLSPSVLDGSSATTGVTFKLTKPGDLPISNWYTAADSGLST